VIAGVLHRYLNSEALDHSIAFVDEMRTVLENYPYAPKYMTSTYDAHIISTVVTL